MRAGRGRTWVGSSPLARGLRLAVGLVRQPPGIIPARAGFTIGLRPVPGQGGDHPRSRGVYPEPASPPTNPTGSSPLARGLQDFLSPLASGRRIIPARAGFTGYPAHIYRQHRDHPRSRGVYPAPVLEYRLPKGSSPLARGLLQALDRRRLSLGIIPARAGFTWALRVHRKGPGDHPRSRGVYTPVRGRRSMRSGSSPLARGLLLVPLSQLRRQRIIPARAGFTDVLPVADHGHLDHPRSRGVYSCRMAILTTMRGSSPLARGLRGNVP